MGTWGSQRWETVAWTRRRSIWGVGGGCIFVWVVTRVFSHVKGHQAVNLRFMHVTYQLYALYTSVKRFKIIIKQCLTVLEQVVYTYGSSSSFRIRNWKLTGFQQEASAPECADTLTVGRKKWLKVTTFTKFQFCASHFSMSYQNTVVGAQASWHHEIHRAW